MPRRRWRVPKTDPKAAEEARKAVSEAVQGLDEVLGRDPIVTERARKLEQIHRENNLGPKVAAAFGVRPC